MRFVICYGVMCFRLAKIAEFGFLARLVHRKCPITVDVFEEIRGWMKDGDKEQDRLFTPSFRTNCSPQLRKSCEIRGIEPFSIYGLRRLRVDTLQRQGIEPAVYEWDTLCGLLRRFIGR